MSLGLALAGGGLKGLVHIGALKALEELGLKVTFGKYVMEADPDYMCASRDARVEDLNEAFKDKNVKAILTVIGGFNVNQILDYIDYDAKMKGFPIDVSQGVYSSDSTPFADKNIPAVSFARITPSGGGEIHSRHDVIEHLSKRYLDEDIRYIASFTEQMANAFVCPVKKEMPENMRKELDQYLGKEEKK